MVPLIGSGVIQCWPRYRYPTFRSVSVARKLGKGWIDECDGVGREVAVRAVVACDVHNIPRQAFHAKRPCTKSSQTVKQSQSLRCLMQGFGHALAAIADKEKGLPISAVIEPDEESQRLK